LDRRRAVAGISCLASLSAISGVFAQQQRKVWRVGFLAPRSRSTVSNPDLYYDAFVQAMRDLGYVEGRNLVIEWRFADGNYDALPALAVQLVKIGPDVIVTHSGPGALAAKRATSTIPIVFASVANPVETGVTASLAHPGGNITGLSMMASDLSGKYFELLKLMTPKLARVAVLGNPTNPSLSVIFKNVHHAAEKFGVTVVPVEARTRAEIDEAFPMIVRERAGALLVTNDALFAGQRQQLASLALKHRLPSMFPFREDAKAGGLMSYGQDLASYYRRAATYVDKILKGTKPGDMPVEQPTKFELVINRKTAKALGIAIPEQLLIQADEVIQ
jgi:putative ABC transport system substrate-binding protein